MVLIPKLLTAITGKPRYLPEFSWEGSITHKVFRFLELVFWREVGIRAELSAYNDNGKTVYQAHSLEAACAVVEIYLRNMFVWRPVKVWIPVFQTPQGIPLPASPYLFAIAFDAAQSGSGGAGTSDSIASFAITGSDILLIEHLVSVNSTITGASFNSVAMTSVDNRTLVDGANMAMFVSVGVSGTHTLTGTWNSSAFGIIIGTSYSGVNQSTTPDAKGFNQNGTAADPQTLVTSCTVVAANCWTFLTNYSSNSAAVAGAGSFRRQLGSNITIAAFDSNGTVATGSVSMTVTETGTGTRFGGIIASFAPAAAATNIKNVDGVANASIKAVDDVVRASIKAIDDVT